MQMRLQQRRRPVMHRSHRTHADGGGWFVTGFGPRISAISFWPVLEPIKALPSSII